jgi:hypothetical protein
MYIFAKHVKREKKNYPKMKMISCLKCGTTTIVPTISDTGHGSKKTNKNKKIKIKKNQKKNQ